MPAPRRRVPSDRRSRPALALGAWLVVVAAPALAGDAAPLPAAVVAKIEQKAVQLDEDRLKGLPAASRRGVLQTFVLSSFAQAADLPGFDENLLSPAQRAQADRVLADVLEGPPPPPHPHPTPPPGAPPPPPPPPPGAPLCGRARLARSSGVLRGARARDVGPRHARLARPAGAAASLARLAPPAALRPSGRIL
jgi:hypothetical protein